MSTTMTFAPIRRWRATGTSSGPQGADGVDMLARTAFAALMASKWEYDEDSPILPVHEFDRNQPVGQAYKAVWGYDAEARTERSCCGAACYTYALPRDAMDSENANGVALVGEIVAKVAVDRYCDKGALLHYELSQGPDPGSVSSAWASASAGRQLFATDIQTDATGQALPPNRRAADGGPVSFDMDGANPAAYLHVYLFMADYLGTRGAWIEGGAIFAEETVTVEFSRDVAADTDDDASVDVVPMSIGRIDFGAGNNPTTPLDALGSVPRLSLWINWKLQAESGIYGNAKDTSITVVFKDLLSFLYSGSALYNGTGAESGSSANNNVAAATEVTLSGVGCVGVSGGSGSAPTISFAAMVAHGLTEGGVFRALSLSSPIDASSVPMRLLVYGISGTTVLASQPPSATPLPWWGSVLSEEFRRGKAAQISVLTNPAEAEAEWGAAAEGSAATTGVSVAPLAAMNANGEVSRIPFVSPWRTSELSTIVLALLPASAPSSSSGDQPRYDVTVNRTWSAATSNIGAIAATKTSLAAVATSNDFRYTIGPSIMPAQLFYHRSASGVGVVHTAYANGYSTDEWIDASGAVFSNTRSFSVTNGHAALVNVRGTIEYLGKTYTVDTDYVESQAFVSFAGTLISNAAKYKQGNSSTMNLVASAPSGTADVVATATDGSTITVRLNIPAAEMASALQTAIGGQYFGSLVSSASVHQFGLDKMCDSGFFPRKSITGTLTGTVISESAYSYAWDNQSNGSVSLPVTTNGTARFTKNGVVYRATLPEKTETMTVTVSNKSAANAAIGINRTATATASIQAPAFEETLDFVGENGLVVRAIISVPSRQVAASGNIKAISAYNELVETLGSAETTHADGAVDTASYAMEDDIDPGLLLLEK